jgi:hypothetical protein
VSARSVGSAERAGFADADPEVRRSGVPGAAPASAGRARPTEDTPGRAGVTAGPPPAPRDAREVHEARAGRTPPVMGSGPDDTTCRPRDLVDPRAVLHPERHGVGPRGSGRGAPRTSPVSATRSTPRHGRRPRVAIGRATSCHEDREADRRFRARGGKAGRSRGLHDGHRLWRRQDPPSGGRPPRSGPARLGCIDRAGNARRASRLRPGPARPPARAGQRPVVQKRDSVRSRSMNHADHGIERPAVRG